MGVIGEDIGGFITQWAVRSRVNHDLMEAATGNNGLPRARPIVNQFGPQQKSTAENHSGHAQHKPDHGILVPEAWHPWDAVQGLVTSKHE